MVFKMLPSAAVWIFSPAPAEQERWIASAMNSYERSFDPNRIKSCFSYLLSYCHYDLLLTLFRLPEAHF